MGALLQCGCSEWCSWEDTSTCELLFHTRMSPYEDGEAILLKVVDMVLYVPCVGSLRGGAINSGGGGK